MSASIPAPRFAKGQQVQHTRRSDGLVRVGSVCGIHTDDLVNGVYYTLHFTDGTEIQTDENRLCAAFTKKQQPPDGSVWVKVLDPKHNMPYYYNYETEESSWTKPEGVPLSAIQDNTLILASDTTKQDDPSAVSAKKKWFKLTHQESGRHYFFNSETGKSVWKLEPHEEDELERQERLENTQSNQLDTPSEDHSQQQSKPPFNQGKHASEEPAPTISAANHNKNNLSREPDCEPRAECEDPLVGDRVPRFRYSLSQPNPQPNDEADKPLSSSDLLARQLFIESSSAFHDRVERMSIKELKRGLYSVMSSPEEVAQIVEKKHLVSTFIVKTAAASCKLDNDRFSELLQFLLGLDGHQGEGDAYDVRLAQELVNHRFSDMVVAPNHDDIASAASQGHNGQTSPSDPSCPTSDTDAPEDGNPEREVPCPMETQDASELRNGQSLSAELSQRMADGTHHRDDTTSWRDQIVAFYTEHNPAKLADVDKILEKYKGDEQLMMMRLRYKYGLYSTEREMQQFEEGKIAQVPSRAELRRMSDPEAPPQLDPPKQPEPAVEEQRKPIPVLDSKNAAVGHHHPGMEGVACGCSPRAGKGCVVS